MTATAEERVLRGGSLNRTVLRWHDDAGPTVRKSVSLTQNREYGFVRWYSQFKRLQRYNTLFPDLFPRVLAAGQDERQAFFDLEFIPDSVDVKQYLSGPVNCEAIGALHQRLWVQMDRLHGFTRFASYAGSMTLYFEEEIAQRLNDAMAHQPFREFCRQERLLVDGEPCDSLLKNLDWLQREFSRATLDHECLTHGNITLENILYVPSSGRVVFIDPYEENVVDCREAEYSQVLQCSNQFYGYINDREVRVSGAQVRFPGTIPSGFRIFNRLFMDELKRRLSEHQILIVSLFEASQFTRMLPFKVLAGHVEKAMYFFGVASRLVQSIRRDYA